MDKPIKANLGNFEKARYFERTADKKQAFFIDVVETPRVFNDQAQKWEDGEARWYKAKFEGADADWVKDLRAGDSLVLFGKKENQKREVDGKTYRSTNLYVQIAALNPHLNRFTIDRTPRAGQEQAQAPSQSLEADPDAAAQSESAPTVEQVAGPEPQQEYRYDELDPTAIAAAGTLSAPIDRPDPLSELYARTEQLVGLNRINPQFSSLIRDAIRDTQGGPGQERRMVREIISALPVADREYLGSCVDQAAGQGQILTWEECEQAQLRETPQPPQNPWPAVDEIRRDLGRETAAPAVAM